MLMVLGSVLANSPVLAQGASAEDLVFITEQFPPYNFEEDARVQGLSVDLLEGALDRMGVDLNRSEIQILSWSEGYQRALKENGTVLFSTVPLPEREESFKWAGPIITVRDVLVARKDGEIEISGLEDIGKYRVGAVEDDSNMISLLVLGAREEDLVVEKEGGALLEMLVNGSVDLLAYEEISAFDQLERLGAEAEDYEVVYVLGVYDLYYAFNANVSATLVQAFQDGLNEAMRVGDDGTSEYQRILYRHLPAMYSEDNVTKEEVVELVDLTAADLEEDAPATLAKIDAGEHPYVDKEDPSLYVFVYDTKVNLVADAGNPGLSGQNMSGKTDVSGKAFRDELIAGALNNGTGWVDYIWTNPALGGLFYKTTYYRLVTGSDGAEYVVCAGRYKEAA
jgi:polar amino acid transport system substrate-binding protein